MKLVVASVRVHLSSLGPAGECRGPFVHGPIYVAMFSDVSVNKAQSKRIILSKDMVIGYMGRGTWPIHCTYHFNFPAGGPSWYA